MPKVTFITPAGDEVMVENGAGNLMSIALANGVDGIDGDCGGVCSCATCHLYVESDWVDKVGPANDMESGMLEFEDNAKENSRLGCQVEMTDELDGLVVRVAPR